MASTDKITHQPSSEDEERFRSLFMNCPVSLWEEDFTDLVAYLDSLRSSGITDPRAYFDQHPDEIIRRVGMIKVLEVNKATLELFEAPNKNSLLAHLSSIIAEEARATFREVLIAVAEGKKEFAAETVSRTLRGKILYINLRWSILPDSGGKSNRALISITDITDRKRVEEELGMLKHSIDVYYDSAYWIDSDNKFVYVNDAACKALGYKRQELIGKTINEVSPRANVKLMKEVWDRLRQGGSYSVESVHRHKDGSEFPVEVVTTYVRFGGREYICGFARDITERRKAADNLIHSHTLMQYIISHAQSAIAVHDRDLKYVYVSEQYLREYKVKEKDVIGRHHYEVFPDLPQKWRDVHQRVLAGAVESNEEDPYVREDGSVDWTRWECRPWHETDGSIGGLIVYTEVITERKEMEKLLQRQRAQLEEAQRISKVGSWERDISTNAVTWSDELMRIFGINPREQRPTFKMLLDMMHPDDREPFQKAAEEAIFEKKPYSIEYRIVRGDGSTQFIHARGEAEYDSLGIPILFRGTAQDITERKRMEKNLRENQKLLETIIEAAPT